MSFNVDTAGTMRENLPVTQQEFPFPKGNNIVSITDLKGRITYCNSAFIQASGYTREELLGQAHNIVRHPDVPEEAFRDLWDTIQAGYPWTGIVKNRRKNGDHYWVVANVTPIVHEGQINGYLSVRSEPTREQVAMAEGLYVLLNAQKQLAKPKIGLYRAALAHYTLIGRLKAVIGKIIDALDGPGSLAAQLLAMSAVAGAFAALPTLPAVLVSGLSGVAAAVHAHWRHARTIRALTSDVLTLAACDLSFTPGCSGAGELRLLQMALQQVAVNTRAVIRDVRSEMDILGGVAGEIAAGNQDLSDRTESQAHSLQQTATSMEHITGTSGRSAAFAQEGLRIGGETANAANRSHDAVMQVADAMDAIQESSKRIHDIIQVIEGVAFQTNILALNAAVEAARAGEQGRGFAVVASEVRTLAQRTGDAAREIRSLIEEATGRIEQGHRQTTDARERMKIALTAVTSVTSLLEQISDSTNEQQSGIGQVNEAVSNMDGITQQNVAMVEELAASATTLSHQIETVIEAMHVFRLSAQDMSLADLDAVSLRRDARRAKSSANS